MLTEIFFTVHVIKLLYILFWFYVSGYVPFSFVRSLPFHCYSYSRRTHQPTCVSRSLYSIWLWLPRSPFHFTVFVLLVSASFSFLTQYQFHHWRKYRSWSIVCGMLIQKSSKRRVKIQKLNFSIFPAVSLMLTFKCLWKAKSSFWAVHRAFSLDSPNLFWVLVSDVKVSII